MATVHDVAAYILKRGGSMSTMKLQKLCYYSQGWSLAWDEKPLFGEDIQAWANGPVVYELFKCHRGQFQVGKWPKGDARNLTHDEKETVDAVLGSYGKLTGQQLSDKTHAERPWVEARKGLSSGAASSVPISLESMQEFFGALAIQEANDAEEGEQYDDEIDEAYYEYLREREREAYDAVREYEPDEFDWGCYAGGVRPASS